MSRTSVRRPRLRLRSARLGLAITLAAAAACTPPEPSAPLASGTADWNVSAITWLDHDPGLAAARARRRPIVLVFYTDWCPHCHNYSRVFHDPEVVRLSRQLIMIRVERDAHRELSARYDLDGEYIPRTFFLTWSGEVLTELRSHNPIYRFFLDEHDPVELVALMRRALAAAPPQPSAD